MEEKRELLFKLEFKGAGKAGPVPCWETRGKKPSEGKTTATEGPDPWRSRDCDYHPAEAPSSKTIC